MSSSAPRRKIRLGDLLVEQGLISDKQLQQALDHQKKSGSKLGRTLIELGLISEQQMLELLSRQLDIPMIDLKHYQFDPEVVRKLPETYARRFRAIVLAEESDGSLLVGMADPTDIFGFDELGRILKASLRLAIVREADLLQTFDQVYRRTQEISNLAQELGEELSESDYDVEALLEEDEDSDIPVAKLLKSLLEDAVQVGASDIHIEPDERTLRVRQRVDGVLQEQEMKERRIAPALVLRLKLMGGLDISEKRIPQDGRFNVRVKKRSIDVRLSTMPVQYGESVVMRLLDQTGELLDLSTLGMPHDLIERLRRNFHHPHGMVLVTGPTGSGKTTTLYSVLRELNNAEKKIITAEDPVEYRMARVNQVQVQPRIGLDFARILRTALRQDPDVMLIGEMRDTETADVGLRAALTGHMVLSTLHTNDAVSTIDRLLDMGAQGYLLASTLRAVLGQRLLRRVCSSCKQAYRPEAAEHAWLEALVGEARAAKMAFQHGHGCAQCNRTGYSGRIGVYELLELTPEMRSALRRGDSAAFAEGANRAPGYRPLVATALDFAMQGITSLSEVERIAGEVEQTFDESLADTVEMAEAEEGDGGEQPMTLEPLSLDDGRNGGDDASV